METAVSGEDAGVTGIKICGITNMAEIDWLNEAHVDYAGFVFYEKSKRYIPIEAAREIGKKLDPNIKKVAVTVSPDVALAARIRDAGFDILQIHGDFAKELKENAGIPVWRAMNISGVGELTRLEQELWPCVSGVLVDAGDFGSGRTFGWEQTAPDVTFRKTAADRGLEFILAGGLNSANVVDGIRLFHPDVVDVSSGVEEVPENAVYGHDGEEARAFCAPVRPRVLVRKSRERIFAFCGAVRSVL